MRYLFRGKVADEPNEWVYGSFVNDDKIFQRKAHDGSKACDMGSFKVLPETVGACTWLKDKNDKNIFTGDILKVTTLDTKKDRYFKVCFGKYHEEPYDCGHIGYYVELNGECTSIMQVKQYRKLVEVVGNIYDNPELLEGEK